MKTPAVSISKAVLPSLDIIRAQGAVLGLRPFRVTAKRRVWTDGRPGKFGSSATDTNVVLTNRDQFGNAQPILVRQVNRREVIASGGLYTDRDLKVGPINPAYAASAFGPGAGFTDATIDPAPIPGIAVEVFWIVQGVGGTFGLPPGGADFEKVGEDSTALHYYVYLRQTGRIPGPPPKASPDEMEIHITVGLSSLASQSLIPAGSDVLRAYVRIGTSYSAGATLAVGQTGSTSLLAGTSVVNLQAAPGTEVDLPGALGVAWGSSQLPVLATVAGSPSVGSLDLYVVYNPTPQA